MAKSKQAMNQEIEEIKQKISNALALAKSFGVSGAEIAISRQRGLSVTTRNCDVETVEFNQDGALGISVFRNGRKGSASTSDLSDDALKRTVKAACDIANHTSEDDCAGLAEPDGLEYNPKDLELFHPHEVTTEQAIEMAKESERAAFDHSDKITNSDAANVSAHEGFRVYGNTHGQLVGYPTSRYSVSCGVIAQGDDIMQRDSQYTLSRQFDKLRSPAAVGVEAAQSTLAKLNAKKLGSMQVPVIFRSEVASSLFSHLVSAIGGGNVYRKSTFFARQGWCSSDGV
jgi:PmbA protein